MTRTSLQGRFTMGVAARPGFTSIPEGMRPQLRVSVGGDAFRTVVACDTWQGWADYVRRDDRGELVMLAGAAQLERVHGAVDAALLAPSSDDVDVLQRRGLVVG